MRNVKASTRAIAILSVTLLVATAADLSGQETTKHRRTVTVNGEGKVMAQPDLATVRFSVVTRDPDPEAARSRNAEASKKALETVRDVGIDDDDIKLEQLSLSPIREWDKDQRRHIEVGFEVNRSATVDIEKLDLVPTVVARVIQSGANRLNSVQYRLSNDAEMRSEALSKAVDNAREKATVMLSGLDERLGRVLELREQSVHIPTPMVRSFAMASAEKAADPTPEAYAPGQVEITAQVIAMFEIE